MNRDKNVSTVVEHLHVMPRLARKATILAAAIDEFVVEVSKDTGTHDGMPRGMFWKEGENHASADSLFVEAERLYALADLWDRG